MKKMHRTNNGNPVRLQELMRPRVARRMKSIYRPNKIWKWLIPPSTRTDKLSERNKKEYTEAMMLGVKREEVFRFTCFWSPWGEIHFQKRAERGPDLDLTKVLTVGLHQDGNLGVAQQ